MSSRKCKLLDEDCISSGFLDSFDWVLTDCDGVLWMGNDAIPGSVEAINALNKIGKKIIYVTNNSTKARHEYVKKCKRLGFPANLNDVFPTSYCVAVYLLANNFKKKVYVFGSTGITQELDEASIPYLPIGPDPVSDNWIHWISHLKLDPEVGAVVVGFDEHVSYPKLTKAASYLKKSDCLFIATNKDEQFPTDGNLIIPGTGTFVSAVETVSGRKALSVGKPSQYMLDCIKQAYPKIDISRCIMIGDRLNTDILWGTSNGLKTLFVLTGINSLEDVKKMQLSTDTKDHLLVPDYYLPSLGDLLKYIK